MPCLHSCYQRQGVACCVCVHIRQMWFTNCDADLVKWYLHEVHDGEIAPTFVLCSSEAWFRVSGYVTSRNNRYRSAKNLMLINRLPIYMMLKVGVWCYCCSKDSSVNFFCDHKFSPVWYTHTDTIFFFFYKRSFVLFYQDGANGLCHKHSVRFLLYLSNKCKIYINNMFLKAPLQVFMFVHHPQEASYYVHWS
jgi:hypothetical protein